jgi:CelD/BcsL family acetyltransferase involved in cellulose biosynthesis
VSANACVSANASCGDGALQFEIIEDFGQIEFLASNWDDLLQYSVCNRAFSCSKWFLASCRHNARLVPHAVIAKRGSEVAGVFPLALRKDTGILGFASELSDYNDVIVRRNDLSTSAGLLEYVLSGFSAPSLLLSNLRRDSNCIRACNLVKGQAETERLFQVTANCFYVKLPGSFEEYLTTRSRAFRKGLKRIRRNIEQSTLQIRRLTLADVSPACLPELFFRLNESRFQEKCHFVSAATRAFVTELFPSLFVEGRLIVFALLESSEPIAMDICMRGPGSYCSWNGGFLPSAEPWSPGRLLLAEGIEQACAMGLKEYDLLRGSHAYKASWATDSRSIGKLEFKQSLEQAATDHETKSAYCMQR